MSELETEQHRTAWRVVVAVMPGSEFVSHHVELDDGDMCAVRFPEVLLGKPLGCPRCGDPKGEMGLNTPGTVDKVLCRDWHDVCECGALYGQPKNPGCLRQVRTGPGGEKTPAHTKVVEEVCVCGRRFDEPKAKGCRRRKHVKEVVK